jgi:hypothetical protein
MSKIAEKMFEDDGKIIVQQTHDFTPVLEKAKALKSAGADSFGESKLVGLIPMKVWAEWAKKWGVNPNDTAAMREVVAREMNNSDNAHLRVWEGRY